MDVKHLTRTGQLTPAERRKLELPVEGETVAPQGRVGGKSDFDRHLDEVNSEHSELERASRLMKSAEQELIQSDTHYWRANDLLERVHATVRTSDNK